MTPAAGKGGEGLGQTSSSVVLLMNRTRSPGSRPAALSSAARVKMRAASSYSSTGAPARARW
nr:MAG TPA: hypothetical protein [Caudoviricetes sp.]